MTWEPRPLPHVTPESRPYWEAAADGELLLCECGNCGLVYFYPRAFCPDCFSDDIDWIAAEGTGTVYTYSVAEQIEGWPEETLPHVVAYVELDEGPRIVTNLVDCDPDDVEVGDPVTVRFEESADGDIAIPLFTLA
jgi:uncharacterized OB-fold protein